MERRECPERPERPAFWGRPVALIGRVIPEAPEIKLLPFIPFRRPDILPRSDLVPRLYYVPGPDLMRHRDLKRRRDLVRRRDLERRPGLASLASTPVY